MVIHLPHNGDMLIPIPPDNLDLSSEIDDVVKLDVDSSLEFILQENKRYFEPFDQHDLKY